VSAYVSNSEWQLIGMWYDFLIVDSCLSASGFSAAHWEQQYECCPQTYQSVTLTIQIQKNADHFATKSNGSDIDDK
jgi:hypothetical protein